MSSSLSTASISIPDLRSTIRGRVIAPSDADYDEARTVFFGDVDRRPAVIVRAADADDVATVVTLARETGLRLAVRSGGHSAAGHGVDRRRHRARPPRHEGDRHRRRRADRLGRRPGLTAAELSTAVGAHGLAIGFGDTGSVGIGGITARRRRRLPRPQVRPDDRLAARRRHRHRRRPDAAASTPSTHPDLFWAIRGGGGNFGVATALPVPAPRGPPSSSAGC